MEITAGELKRNETSANARGGTELLAERLFSAFDKEVLEPYQIIFGRVRELKDDKIRILYCHDLPGDPENDHLRNNGWMKFHKIVFVSYWQKNEFQKFYGIPSSRCFVIQNSIIPIQEHTKPKGKIRLGYWSTPHRGLEILVPVFKKLKETNDIELDVYSSFKLYGWEERDKQFASLIEECKTTEGINYYGSVSNEDLRKGLEDIHILAYPSIWPETSCLVLMEAMSAGCLCIHSDLTALSETASNWTLMYPFHEDINKHATSFYTALKTAIDNYESPQIQWTLEPQKAYADIFYNWENRKKSWAALFAADLGKEKTFLSDDILSFDFGR